VWVSVVGAAAAGSSRGRINNPPLPLPSTTLLGLTNSGLIICISLLFNSACFVFAPGLIIGWG
jgi:hypothetical protein